MAPGLLRDLQDNIYTQIFSRTSSNSSLPAIPLDSFGQEKIEPIAVVGFSLKFPQDATSPESFWKMLVEKRCATTQIPEDRLKLDSFYGTDKNRNDTVMTCNLSNRAFLTNFGILMC
jgi:Beta-ketoacyl synthase, N-terminal domain